MPAKLPPEFSEDDHEQIPTPRARAAGCQQPADAAGNLPARDQRNGAPVGPGGTGTGRSASREGDVRARDRMVRANLRLVVNIARGYTGKGLSLQDLIEEGNLGLLRAVEGFDPAVGTRFSTYASYWIKQSIKRALINSAKTIRIPAYMVELLSKWRRANARLTEELGRTPTPEEIARVLGLAAQEAADHQEGHPHLQLHAADRSGRRRLVAGRDDHGRADEDARRRTGRTRRADARAGDDRDDGPARGHRAADAVRAERHRTAHAEGNRRTLGLTRERVRQIETEALDKLADSLKDPHDRRFENLLLR